jgi:hypothetical protein
MVWMLVHKHGYCIWIMRRDTFFIHLLHLHIWCWESIPAVNNYLLSTPMEASRFK